MMLARSPVTTFSTYAQLQPSTCNLQPSKQLSTCNVQRATFNQLSTFNFQHVTSNLQLATNFLQLSTSNLQLATCNHSWPVTAFGRPKLSRQLLVGARHPSAQYRTGVTRVDNFLDAKCFSGSERRPQQLELLLDLTPVQVGIRRGFYFSPVGSLDSALYRQRTPIPGGPGIAQVEPLGVAVARSGHAKHAPDYDRDPGNRCLIHRRKGTCAHPYCPHLFGGRSD